MEKSAATEGRIISPKEASMRKNIGMAGLGLTALALFLLPGTRTAYPTVSFFVAQFLGVWRTGNLSL